MSEVSSESASTELVASRATAQPYRFVFATDAILGSRETQEDSRGLLFPNGIGGNECYIPGPNGLSRAGETTNLVAVVADGVGGEEAGEVASSLACRAFLTHVDAPGLDWAAKLDRGLERANEAIAAEISEHPAREGMATTLVAAVFTPEGLGWVSVGDSVLYRWRSGKLERLNADHSVRGIQMKRAERGEITFAEARTYPGNVLVHVLNGQPLGHFEQFAGFQPHQDGDVILVCSDGVKTLADEEIAGLVKAHAQTPSDLVRVLLAQVQATAERRAEEQNRKTRQDNTSVIAVRIAADSATVVTTGRPPPTLAPTPDTLATAPVPPPPKKGRSALLAAAALALAIPVAAAAVWWYAAGRGEPTAAVKPPEAAAPVAARPTAPDTVAVPPPSDRGPADTDRDEPATAPADPPPAPAAIPPASPPNGVTPPAVTPPAAGAPPPATAPSTERPAEPPAPTPRPNVRIVTPPATPPAAPPSQVPPTTVAPPPTTVVPPPPTTVVPPATAVVPPAGPQQVPGSTPPETTPALPPAPEPPRGEIPRTLFQPTEPAAPERRSEPDSRALPLSPPLTDLPRSERDRRDVDTRALSPVPPPRGISPGNPSALTTARPPRPGPTADLGAPSSGGPFGGEPNVRRSPQNEFWTRRPWTSYPPTRGSWRFGYQ